MQLEYVKAFSAAGLLVVTILATMIPLFIFKKSHICQHELEFRFPAISFLNCFAGGVFFGTCLLNLFPEVKEEIDSIFKAVNIIPNYPVSEFLLGFGFLAILIVEQIILNCQGNVNVPALGTNRGPSNSQTEPDDPYFPDDESSRLIPNPTISYGTLGSNHNHSDNNAEIVFEGQVSSRSILRSLLLVFALSLHSIFEGLSIGLLTSVQTVVRVLVAVAIHKSIIAFTLGLSLVRSELSSCHIIQSNLFFSLTSPIGILIGLAVVDLVAGVPLMITSGILQGLAAGTFLYVTLFEVLHKELASGRNRMVKMACVVLGYSVVSLLLTILPD